MNILRFIDRLIPREVAIPIMIGLAGENILSYILSHSIPPRYGVLAWVVVFFVGVIFGGYWSSGDEEDNFE